MPSIVRRALAEMYGTFALVFFGVGAVVMESFPNARGGLLAIALVHAFVLSVSISATMAISGGHLNPAVTLALLSVRRIGIVDALVYIGSQLAGGVLAAFAASKLLPAGVGDIVAWGTPMLNSQVTQSQGMVLEAVLTFFLVSAVMGTVAATDAPRIGGFGIGLSLFFLIMVGGPLTGAAMNPARAFGPATVSGVFSGQIVYWIGPIIGAIVAAQFWQRVLLKEETVPV